MIYSLLARVEPVGLAIIEHKYRKHSSKSKPKEVFHPFEEMVGLEDIKLEPLEKVRGWQSMIKVITFWQFTCGVIVIIGIGLILLGFLHNIT